MGDFSSVVEREGMIELEKPIYSARLCSLRIDHEQNIALVPPWRTCELRYHRKLMHETNIFLSITSQALNYMQNLQILKEPWKESLERRRGLTS
jgi:hypothetical protein